MNTQPGLCLVTGATGFVGKFLVNALLDQGIPVRAVVRSHAADLPEACDIVQAALTPEPGSAIERALEDVTTVFHLAGVAHTRATDEEHKRSAEISQTLARQCLAAGVARFVYVSSTKAMVEPGELILDETSTDWPADAYGYWKRHVEEWLLEEAAFPHLAILRPCLVYGPGVRGNLLSLLKAVDRGLFPPLPETGCVRSMVSVQDVVAALLLLASEPQANRRVFIASDGVPYTAHQIYRDMRQALGKGEPVADVPLCLLHALGKAGDLITKAWAKWPVNSGAINRLTGPAVYSSAQLRALGWLPVNSFELALPSMVEAYRQGLQ
jgi:UDP-glucose 4-epimerase